MCIHAGALFFWLSARVLNSNLNLNSNSFELRGKRKEKRNRKRNPKPKPRNSAQHPTPPFSRTARAQRPTPSRLSPRDPASAPLQLNPASRAQHSVRPSSPQHTRTRSPGPRARPSKHPVQRPNALIRPIDAQRSRLEPEPSRSEPPDRDSADQI